MPRPLTILHEEGRLLVVAKPPGLLTVPAPRGSRSAGQDSLVARLEREGWRVRPVHRLDRETSGAVMLARDPEAREVLMELFKERGVSKTYLAVVQGHPRPAEGTLDLPIRDLGSRAEVHRQGRPSRTRYRVVETLQGAAVVEAEPVTGRHNQIRLHFAHVRHPLVGERKYARGRDAAVRHKRAALHALALAWTCPWTARPRKVEAPLPRDLQNLLDRLRS